MMALTRRPMTVGTVGYLNAVKMDAQGVEGVVAAQVPIGVPALKPSVRESGSCQDRERTY